MDLNLDLMSQGFDPCLNCDSNRKHTHTRCHCHLTLVFPLSVCVILNSVICTYDTHRHNVFWHWKMPVSRCDDNGINKNKKCVEAVRQRQHQWPTHIVIIFIDIANCSHLISGNWATAGVWIYFDASNMLFMHEHGCLINTHATVAHQLKRHQQLQPRFCCCCLHHIVSNSCYQCHHFSIANRTNAVPRASFHNRIYRLNSVFHFPIPNGSHMLPK